MKRALSAFIGSALTVVPAAADIPVIDKTNYAVARETADTTSKILDTNKDILTTVEETLKAVTGDRAGEAGSLKDLAIGNGFSVSSVPSFETLLQNETPDFGSTSGGIAQAATLFINGLQLVKSLSGKEDSQLSSDKSYEELMKTVLGVSALITGSTQAVKARRTALDSAGQGIGRSEDIKGSIDQNTQLQVQTGLTLNEMIGVLNAGVQSLHAENQRKLTDMSNTRKALQYE
jgi:hypothetical protein